MESPRASKPKSDRSRLLLRPSAPADLQQKVQKMQLAISRRAHELFEARGCEHGHDLEDWLRAESELLCPVSIAMSESKGLVSVRAEVPAFRKNEIEVSVEPRCITILGKRKQTNAKFEVGTTEKSQPHPDQVLEVVELATEVVPERAIISWQTGVLSFELPTVPKNKIETAA